MFSCLVQQFVSVGIGYGLSIMYAELIKVFDVRRSEAALVQGLHLGLSVGSGSSYIYSQISYMQPFDGQRRNYLIRQVTDHLTI